MKCQAYILKEYKTTKADCVHPVTLAGRDLEVCSGTITAILDMEYTGACQCEGASLRVKFTCSRCKWPYYPAMEEFRRSIEWQPYPRTGVDITLLMEPAYQYYCSSDCETGGGPHDSPAGYPFCPACGGGWIIK